MSSQSIILGVCERGSGEQLLIYIVNNTAGPACSGGGGGGAGGGGVITVSSNQGVGEGRAKDRVWRIREARVGIPMQDISGRCYVCVGVGVGYGAGVVSAQRRVGAVVHG